MGKPVQCANCGAMLTREDIDGDWGKCDFCGTEIRLASAGEEPASASAPAGSGPYLPPPGEYSYGQAPLQVQPPVVIAPPSVKPRKPAVLGVIVAFAVISAVVTGAIPLVLLMVAGTSSRSSSSTLLQGGSGNAPAPAMTVDPKPKFMRVLNIYACGLDADGDGIEDLAVLFNVEDPRAGSYRVVRLFDGETGSTLDDGPGITESGEALLVCLNENWAAWQTSDFNLHLIGGQDPRVGPVIALRDKVVQLASGKKCIGIRTADNSTIFLNPITGMEGNCEARGWEYINTPRGMPTFQWKRTFVDGKKSELVVSSRQSGTPLLSVVNRKGGKALWSKELSIKATSFGIPSLLAGEVVAVVGSAHPDGQPRLVGLDRATGDILYDRAIESTVIGTFGCAFWWNGKYMILDSSHDELMAIDPATGQQAWSVE